MKKSFIQSKLKQLKLIRVYNIGLHINWNLIFKQQICIQTTTTTKNLSKTQTET